MERSRPYPNGCCGVASRWAFLPPTSSRNWFPESARECTPSASIDEEPLNANATNFDAAIARLAPSAATIALVPPDALICSRCPFASSASTPVQAFARPLPWGHSCSLPRHGRLSRPQARSYDHTSRSHDHRCPEDRARTGHLGLLARRYEHRLAGAQFVFPGSHGTCRAEQDLWGRAGQVVGGAAFGKDVAGEAE